MRMPITREVALEACVSMKNFHSELTKLYDKHGMNLLANRGRRNVLMSAPMEHFLAQAIRNSFCPTVTGVECDGRTGEADITVHTSEHGQIEIECKLTSPHQSSGSIAFQTDHDTLMNKGSLDYVYIIADENFESFCVIYFQDLTIDDFRGLSPGARGKVQMYKWAGMKKGTVLVGEAISSNDVKIEKITNLSKKKIEEKTVELTSWRKELETMPLTSNYKRKKLTKQIHRGLDYVDNLVNNTAENVRITRQSKARYSFRYEKV